MNPILMKCTQEQYNKIKPILLENGFKEENISCFEQHPYLINNWGPEDYKLGNGDLDYAIGRKVFNEWNEDIFLKCCDIVLKKEPLFTIQDLADGKCAVKNDGIYKELQTVLKAAYPLTHSWYGLNSSSYYYWTKDNYYWKNSELNKSNLPVQSVKEFLKMINEKEPEFVLPEKWCIKLDNIEVVNYCNKYGKCPPYELADTLYAHFPSFDNICTTSKEVKKDYTEITFEQFKKYVLKQEEPLFEVGTQFRHRRNNSLDYTISSINNNQVEVSWNNNKSSTFYSLTDTTHFFKNKIWIKKEPEYKYTPEYCKNNKVAIFVKTQSDIDGLKQLNCTGCMVSLNSYTNGFYTIPSKDTWGTNKTYIEKNYEVINASEFIKNNLKTTNMEKKIIGYKLIKPEYEEVALTIAQLCSWGEEAKRLYVNLHRVDCINRIKEAGVLDLWFAPVYESLETKYTMGSNGNTFELIVKDGRCFHKQEDITNYLRDVQEFARRLPTKFGNYDFKLDIDSIKINKTGCESKETLLSQWLNIKL